MNFRPALSVESLRCATLLAVVALTGACQSMTYRPALSLGRPLGAVELSVEVRDFEDLTPAGDRRRPFPFGGTSATSPSTMAGDLAAQVTNAIVANLAINDVFDRVGKRVDAPDLVMTGKIHRFYAKAGPNVLVLAPYVTFLPFFPIYDDHGAVHIEVELETPGREFSARFTAEETFFGGFDAFNPPMLGVGTRLNHAFDLAMERILTEILLSAAELEANAQRRPAPPHTGPTIGGLPFEGPAAPAIDP